MAHYAAAGTVGPLPLRTITVEPVASLGGKGVRAVLSWGEHPSDLDFHVYKDSGSNATCLQCQGGGAQVCSLERPVFYAQKKSFGGVNLDKDDTTSYGPETLTWDDVAQNGTYHVVVHVYSREGSLRGSDAQVLVALRGGGGLITIQPTAQVLASTCDAAKCAGSACCFWWVGTITKTGTEYAFASTNSEISKPSTC